MTELKKTSLTAMLNGKEITINKLKAGKYYEAQKIYIGLIDKVRQDMKLELKKPQGKEIKPEDVIAKKGLDINSLYSVFPTEIAKLVAFCIDFEPEKLLEEAYPEEISNIATKVIELNNFNENLKNSVAPMMESMGAVK
ncbi:hypothetical protein KY315_02965 [Candidatus Woesearchaeota archaeon]|nr:hypothetical protein [Candidatus Woesearchaeota archaeon]